MSNRLRQALAEANIRLSRACGARDEAVARMITLGDEVSAAKGVLLVREDVEDTLDEFQESVHQKTIGVYEKLLTSLVKEVIGDGSAVRLELSSERGSPCLDLVVERNGYRFNLLDAQGGALNNVVSMGLRLIATLRAGSRPVLVLDELDCWVKPARVPDFYRVMADVSKRMGLQVLVVTHHPPSLLHHVDPRIFLVEGDPMSDSGVSVGISREGPAWDDDRQPGLRRIHLKDFAGYRDCVFDLGPGINVISGDNNVGKSRIPRALRAACYGEGDAHDIRIGRNSATVTIEVEGGQSIEWSRDNKRSPVTLWRRLDAHCAVMATHGGRTPPEWVDEVCGIAKRRGLDIQLGHQFSPVFLLNESGSQRANVLSIGRESATLHAMMRLQRSDVEAALSTVRRGEREIAALDERIRAMTGLDAAALLLDEAGDILSAMEARSTEQSRLLGVIASIRLARKTLPPLQAKKDALDPQAIGEPPRYRDARPVTAAAASIRRARLGLLKSRACIAALSQGLDSMDVPPPARPHSDLATLAIALRTKRHAVQTLQRRIAAIDGVAPPAWATAEAGEARARLARLVHAAKAETAARAALSGIETQLVEAERQWDETLSGLPCPSCGKPISHGGLAGGAHPHAA